ncbi:putative hydroxypyruvate isomerase isoform X2 [Echinops telfairi]|uniref:Hydroxypyruvate isomerase isoform X2 n=1 Tax=Echinops telfairi TaxID=9371 RepID=A0AC55D8H4_ECHTE|nr:putative hydroxypyruvate isomerase isoform X2 [Echinops telfairi]
MAPLRFSANLSWLFPELPSLPERLRAAGSAGFEAAEVAFPYSEPPEALACAAQEAGLRLVLINTPLGDPEKGEMGLGAVPGRQAAFREGLEQAVLYAKALGCPRIHLMAGRVPQGTDRAVVSGEMEAVFLENLRHAAGVLAQENLVGLLEPINTRITDPRYFLDTPQQAAAILQKLGRPNLQLQMDMFHWQIMDGNLTANIRDFLPLVAAGGWRLPRLCGLRVPAPRRHLRGFGMAAFLLGQAGPPTGWPVRYTTRVPLWIGEHSVASPLN